MRILIKILIGMGLFLFLLLWLMIPTLIEKPVVTVDYFTQYNDLIRPENYREDNNAAVALKNLPVPEFPEGDSKSTMFMTVGTPEFMWEYETTDYPDAFKSGDVEKFKKWIAQYTPTFEALVDVSKKPYFYQPVDVSLYRSETLQRQLYNNNDDISLDAYDIQYMMNWAIAYHLKEGNHSKAIAYSQALLILNRFFEASSDPFYSYFDITELVGGWDIQSLCGSDPNEVTSETLLTLQAFLTDCDVAFDTNYELARICFLDTVQKLFTEGDRGHLSAAALVRHDVGYLTFSDTPSVFGCIYRSIRCERRGKTVERMEAILSKLREWEGKSLFELHQQDIDMETEIETLTGENYMVEYYFLPLVHTPVENLRNGCEVEAAAVLIAIFRYQRDKGRFPESLDVLLNDGYLKQLPQDIYSGESLVYRKTPDNFTLYSLGVDFEDDGGRPSLCKNCGNHLTGWGDGPVYYAPGETKPQPADEKKDAEGDQVFWPIIELTPSTPVPPIPGSPIMMY